MWGSEMMGRIPNPPELPTVPDFIVATPPYAEGRITRMEPTLSIDQRFRLIEIAHETKSDAVREEALSMLRANRTMYVKEPLP